MNQLPPYRIFPVGDTALTIDFGNQIDENINKQVLGLFTALKTKPLPGMTEAVPAYSSLTVYYDMIAVQKKKNETAYDRVKQQLEEQLGSLSAMQEENSRLVSIPVCYDPLLAPGIVDLSSTRNISIEEIIHIHTARSYRVYMLGFLPGFAYMGDVDERIVMPRKSKPETVLAGSVGIAGKQTGIYPMTSPGGWCIIGRTPITMFETGEDYKTLLQAGDYVRFTSISKDEFESNQSRHS